MKWKVGDIVHISQSKEDAEIIEILNHKVVKIFVEGAEYLIHVKDILENQNKEEIEVTDIPTQSKNTHSVNQKKKKETPKTALTKSKARSSFKQKNKSGFICSFEVLKSEGAEAENRALIPKFVNLSHITVVLSAEIHLKDQPIVQKKAIVSPNQQLKFPEIPIIQMDGKPRFVFSIQQVAQEVNWEKESGFQVLKEFILTPKRLFQYLNELAEGETEFNIHLADYTSKPKSQDTFKKRSEEIPKIKEKSRVDVLGLTSQRDSIGNIGVRKKEKFRRRNKKDQFEIDLHAENLGISTQGKEHFYILTKQLQALDKAIDQAVRANKSSIIVIHGVGNGKLKAEVQRLLRSHPSIKFVLPDSWRPDYGYGATEAFLK